MSRVVVIGAGMGGLAAALRLAGTGHSVTVFEAADTIGGKLATVEIPYRDGMFRFDVGPSLLTLPQVFDDLFAVTGERLADVVELRPVATRYRFADGAQVSTTRDRVEQAARFDATFGPSAGTDWTALLDRGARIWAASEATVLHAPLSARTALASPRRLRSLAAVRPGQTLRAVGRQYLREPRLRLILERYATYAGSDPRRAPAALAVIPFLEQAFGTWYVTGGLYGIVAALHERLIASGVRVELGAGVEAIDTAGDRVAGVRLADGTRVPADVVVANADAATVYGSLLAGPRPVPAADSSSGFALLLGLRGRTPGWAHHTVLFGPRRYDEEFDALFGARPAPVDEPAIYVCAPAEAGLAPTGHEAWFVLVNAPRHGVGGIDWTAPGRPERYAEHLLDRLARRGLPVTDRIVARQVITPLDLARRTGAPGGAIYGRASHGPFAAFGRPRNVTSIAGLYLVGGSTHPGGGLPLVALSAEIVAGLIGPAR